LLLNHHRELLEEDVAGVRRSSASQPTMLLPGGASPEIDGASAGRVAGGRAGGRASGGRCGGCVRASGLLARVSGRETLLGWAVSMKMGRDDLAHVSQLLLFFYFRYVGGVSQS